MIKVIKPRVRIFVEGKTEDNYFTELGKQLDLDFAIESIDMRGGGYSKFLSQIKKKGHLGCTVIFIVLDLDKVIKEKSEFNKLVSYCNSQNKKCPISYFLVGSYSDFEYFACLHSSDYKNGDTNQFIIKNFNYKSVDEFKSDKKIFKFLNTGGRSKEKAIEKLNNKKAYINNEYRPIKKVGGDIRIENKKIIINDEFENIKNSNINELFNIIGQAIEK